jgi:DNA-binding LacI/PurR family transcriptional regulator
LRDHLTKLGLANSDIRTVIQHNLTIHDLDRILSEVLAGPKSPTAVFAWNDRTAYEFLSACERSSIGVPEDLSVVGYDGIQWSSTSGSTVTSICPSLEELADTAVDVLRQLMEDGRTSIHAQIPGVLVPGTTLAPPSNG